MNRRLATAGVLMGIFLAAVDGTIVSTVMPTVVQSLGGLAYYSWAFAAYMLFAAISMPFFGRLADMYGRRRLFFIGVGVFVLGSALSGLSQSMVELVLFRALQGVGGGAMITLPYAIIGVIYPPESRGKVIGLGSGIWGVSSVLGPLLGYGIVATLSWRWVFFLSVPIGLAAVTLVGVSIEESTGTAERSIDLLGAVTLAVAVVALLVGLQFVQTRTDLAGLLFVVAAVGLAGFYLAERRAAQPLIPLSLFGDGVFRSTNATAFLMSFVAFAAITYVPLFLQSIRGGAESAALAVFPISIGWSFTSVFAGMTVGRIGERRLVTAGTVVMAVSCLAATTWTASVSLPVLFVNAVGIGVGVGAVTTPLLVAIQNHLGDARMGLATSSQQFFRNLGGTLGVGVLGFVMNLVIRDQLTSVPGVSNLDDLQRLLLGSNGAPAGLGAVMAHGLTATFVISALVAVAAVGFSRRVPVSTIRDRAAQPADD